MVRGRATAPATLGECEIGSVVRTEHGLMRVTGWLGDRSLVRFVDAATLADMSEPFFARVDLDVLEVLRDQDYYRMHSRRGGGEVDPLKGK